jgi:hypothetical protein
VVLAGQAAFGCSGQPVNPLLAHVFLLPCCNFSALVVFATTVRTQYGLRGGGCATSIPLFTPGAQPLPKKAPCRQRFLVA